MSSRVTSKVQFNSNTIVLLTERTGVGPTTTTTTAGGTTTTTTAGGTTTTTTAGGTTTTTTPALGLQIQGVMYYYETTASNNLNGAYYTYGAHNGTTMYANSGLEGFIYWAGPNAAEVPNLWVLHDSINDNLSRNAYAAIGRNNINEPFPGCYDGTTTNLSAYWNSNAEGERYFTTLSYESSAYPVIGVSGGTTDPTVNGVYYATSSQIFSGTNSIFWTNTSAVGLTGWYIFPDATQPSPTIKLKKYNSFPDIPVDNDEFSWVNGGLGSFPQLDQNGPTRFIGLISSDFLTLYCEGVSAGPTTTTTTLSAGGPTTTTTTLSAGGPTTTTTTLSAGGPTTTTTTLSAGPTTTTTTLSAGPTTTTTTASGSFAGGLQGSDGYIGDYTYPGPAVYRFNTTQFLLKVNNQGFTAGTKYENLRAYTRINGVNIPQNSTIVSAQLNVHMGYRNDLFTATSQRRIDIKAGTGGASVPLPPGTATATAILNYETGVGATANEYVPFANGATGSPTSTFLRDNGFTSLNVQGVVQNLVNKYNYSNGFMLFYISKTNKFYGGTFPGGRVNINVIGNSAPIGTQYKPTLIVTYS